MKGLEKTISVSELKELPLEERAQVVLRNYFYQELQIKGEGSLISFQPYLEAWAYLEENNYVKLVGGTPKSGAAYGITGEGLLFMDKAL